MENVKKKHGWKDELSFRRRFLLVSLLLAWSEVWNWGWNQQSEIFFSLIEVGSIRWIANVNMNL